MHEWRYLQFNVDSERQIFKTLLIANSFAFRVFARNLLRGNIFRRRNIFLFSFWCLIWDLNSGLRSNKPTQYLPDHGNFLPCHLRGKAGEWVNVNLVSLMWDALCLKRVIVVWRCPLLLRFMFKCINRRITNKAIVVVYIMLQIIKNFY